MNRSPKKGKSSKSSPNLGPSSSSSPPSTSPSKGSPSLSSSNGKIKWTTPPPSPGSKLRQLFSRKNVTPKKPTTISSPFGFTHITHVDFDPDSQELCGLPQDWNSQLQKSVNKMVTHRKDSTAMRTMDPFSNQSRNSLMINPLLPLPLSSTSPDKLKSPGPSSPRGGASSPPPPFLLSEQSEPILSLDKKKKSIKEKERKSSPNIFKTMSESDLSASGALSPNRKSSPIKLNESSVIATGANSASTSKSNSPSVSPSMMETGDLAISHPTTFRRDLHIAWNQDTGQFEGVPPEWEHLMSEVSNEKQRKKNLEGRKKVLLQESLLADKEEKNRRIQRDKRERARLMKDERRKSVYVERSRHDPVPVPPALQINQGPSLWQISGNQILKTKRVALSLDLLCKNDVFILDTGKKIFVWMGSLSSLRKQVRGCSIANKIKYDSQTISEPITVHFIMEKFDSEAEREFFQWLSSGNSPIPQGYAVSNEGLLDDNAIVEEEANTTWLYRVSDNGKISVIEERPILPTFLQTNTCFILDCETDIFVWNGKHSHQLKQKAALIFASEFLNIFSGRPIWASLHVVHQGEEPWFFKERFLYWLEDESILDNTKRNTTMRSTTGTTLNNRLLTPIPIALDSNFHVGDLYNVPDQFQKSILTDSTPGIAEGLSGFFQNVSLDIWKSEGNTWNKVANELYGHFDSNSCYVCHQIYTIAGKYQSRVYFWQGSNAPIRWWIVFQFYLYKEISEHMMHLDAPPPPTECLTQSKESIAFLKLFKNIYIHNHIASSGTTSSGSNLLTSSLVNPTLSSDTYDTLTMSSMSTFMPKSVSNYSMSSVSTSTSFFSITSSPSTSSQQLLFSNSKSILYQLQSIGGITSRSVQFKDGFDISCLNSRDVFVFYSFAAKTIFIWYGKGASKETISEAKKIAESIHHYHQLTNEIPKNETPLIVDCFEGQEPIIFWKLFFSVSCQKNSDLYHSLMNHPQKRDFYVSNPYYCNPELNASQTIRFFHVFYNPRLKCYVTMRVSPFCQSDLCEEDAFLLDCGNKLFVWFGPSSSKKKRETTAILAEKCVAARGDNDTEIIYQEASQESPEFKSFFQAWNNNITLTSMRNNEQSLIGVEADHRIINSIVSNLNSDDFQFDSGDESESPVISPTSSPGHNSILAHVNSDDIESMEPWELDLLQHVETIIPKDHRQKRKDMNSSHGSPGSSNHHLTSSVITNHSYSSPLRFSSTMATNGSDDSSEASTITDLALSDEDDDDEAELKKPSFHKPMKRRSSVNYNYPFTSSISISPASKTKLLELVHSNNRTRKRGSSVLSHKSPQVFLKQLKQKTSINSPDHPHSGSIDSKSMQLLKDVQAYREIGDEVIKMEMELSKLLDDRNDQEINELKSSKTIILNNNNNNNNNENNNSNNDDKDINNGDHVNNIPKSENIETTTTVTTNITTPASSDLPPIVIKKPTPMRTKKQCINNQHSIKDIVNNFNNPVNNQMNPTTSTVIASKPPPKPILKMPLKKFNGKPRSNSINSNNSVNSKPNTPVNSDNESPNTSPNLFCNTTTTLLPPSPLANESLSPMTSPRTMEPPAHPTTSTQQTVPPIIQRTMSTKELIQSAELAIKNHSEQAQRNSPRPLNRSVNNTSNLKKSNLQ